MKKTNKRGFMIIETIIAMSIIVFAIIGPLSAAKSSLTVASDSRDYIESVYLADEIAEYVRMVRDANIYSSNPSIKWLNGLELCKMGAGCGISVSEKNSNIISCQPTGSLPEPCELSYDQSSGLYTYKTTSEWKKSSTVRKVYIDEIIPDEEALITVVIERKRLNLPVRVYTMRGTLMHWKKQLTP